jgi:hypothetical protein
MFDAICSFIVEIAVEDIFVKGDQNAPRSAKGENDRNSQKDGKKFVQDSP